MLPALWAGLLLTVALIAAPAPFATLATQDAGRGERVAARLRLGTVWINDFHPYLPQAEWGGFGKSGVGRELGPAGLAEYRETKHVYQNLAPKPVRWFAG